MPAGEAKVTWAGTVALQPALAMSEAVEAAEIALAIRASRAIPDPGAVRLVVEEATAPLPAPAVHVDRLVWAALVVVVEDVGAAVADGGVNNTIIARTQ